MKVGRISVPDLKADAQLREVHSLEAGVLAGIYPQAKLEHAGLAAHLHTACLILKVLHVLNTTSRQSDRTILSGLALSA